MQDFLYIPTVCLMSLVCGVDLISQVNLKLNLVHSED